MPPRALSLLLCALVLTACAGKPSLPPEAAPTPAPVSSAPAPAPISSAPAPAPSQGDLACGLPPSRDPRTASPTMDWTWVHPQPQGNHLQSVAAGGGRFVAVGAVGALIHSPDGQRWSVSPSGDRRGLRAVAHGNGRFVAVGDAGAATTSRDGVSWQPATIDPSAPDLIAAAFGSGRFVAAASGGKLYTSADGLSWTALTGVPAAGRLCTIAYGSGGFRAGGHAGFLLASADGLTWERVPLNSDGAVVALAEGGGHWLLSTVTTPGAGSLLFTSADGRTWAEAGKIPLPPPDSKGFMDVFGLAHDGRRFVAAGSNPCDLPCAMTASSPDGRTWQSAIVGGGRLRAVAAAGGQSVAVGEWGAVALSKAGTGPFQLVSDPPELFLNRYQKVFHLDGRWLVGGRGESATGRNPLAPADWSRTFESAGFESAAFNSGGFVAVGGGVHQPYGGFRYSRDGQIWSRVADEGGYYRQVVWSGQRFVAVGNRIAHSADGQKWEKRPAVRALSGLAAGRPAAGDHRNRDLLVAVGGSGLLLISADHGQTWVERPLGTSADLTGVAHGGGLFAAWGEGGILITSRDGVSWRPCYNPGDGIVMDLSFTGRGFVAVGTRGLILTSEDGERCTLHEAGTDMTLSAVAFGNGRYVATEEQGRVVVSADGRRWSALQTPTTQTLLDVAFGGGRFVAVGAGRVIITSDGSAPNGGASGTQPLDLAPVTNLVQSSQLPAEMVAGERQPVSVTAPRADRVFLVDQLGRLTELKRGEGGLWQGELLLPGRYGRDRFSGIVKVVGKEQIQYLDLSVLTKPPQR